MPKIKNSLPLLMIFLCLHGQAWAQSLPDSVIRQYKAGKTNNKKLTPLLNYLFQPGGDTLIFENAATIISYLKSAGDQRSQDIIQLAINEQLTRTGEYTRSLSSSLEILNRFEQQNDTLGILSAYRHFSAFYFYTGDKEKCIFFGKKAFLIAQPINNVDFLFSISNNISTFYSQNNMPDSALLYARLAVSYASQSTDVRLLPAAFGALSEAYISAGQYDSALVYSSESLAKGWEGDELLMVWTLNDLSQIFLETNQFDSSKYYAHEAIGISKIKGYKDQTQRAYEYLSRLYDKTHIPDSAFKYLQLAVAIKDSLYSSDKAKQVQEIMTSEQTRLQEIEKEKLAFKNKIRVYGLVGGLTIVSLIMFFLLRNNRQKQKANKILETTLSHLKSTQTQLIQSEKMASLGELTAGIAHEIQNPLNFVNNFSEVNKELIEELKMKNEKLKIDNEEINELLEDIKDNSEKINHHGKRADTIVKGMLQHSQTSKGQKEPTDINALADEYLRLAYHGIRAKDKLFNATLKTDFDGSIGNINIIPQDIGRVLLNLYNNAFYAVGEKQKAESIKQNAYEPIVSVSTKKINDKVEIKVADNGNGILQKIVDKIFQPFFTTKPTGQGTGLGLSLSYDIIKAHGGEIKINSREGEGAEFIIQLPII